MKLDFNSINDVAYTLQFLLSVKYPKIEVTFEVTTPECNEVIFKIYDKVFSRCVHCIKRSAHYIKFRSFEFIVLDLNDSYEFWRKSEKTLDI